MEGESTLHSFVDLLSKSVSSLISDFRSFYNRKAEKKHSCICRSDSEEWKQYVYLFFEEKNGAIGIYKVQ